jgi:hypothetical protein
MVERELCRRSTEISDELCELKRGRGIQRAAAGRERGVQGACGRGIGLSEGLRRKKGSASHLRCAEGRPWKKWITAWGLPRGFHDHLGPTSLRGWLCCLASTSAPGTSMMDLSLAGTSSLPAIHTSTIHCPRAGPCYLARMSLPSAEYPGPILQASLSYCTNTNT